MCVFALMGLVAVLADLEMVIHPQAVLVVLVVGDLEVMVDQELKVQTASVVVEVVEVISQLQMVAVLVVLVLLL